MRALALCFATIFWLVSHRALAQTRTGPLTSPVHCDNNTKSVAPSCGSDISLAAAQAVHKKRDLRLESATDHLICDSHATIGFYYGWAPSDQVIDGSKALATLLRRAETGEVFGGDRQIVQTPESTPDERHLALCFSEVVSGNSGPPTACTTVGIITPSVAWLRTGHDTGMCLLAGEILRSGAIEIDYTVKTSLPLNVFADALQSMLSQQLALATDRRLEGEHHEFVTLRSTASLRNSHTLEGWRESVDFDITLFKDKADVRVNGVAHIAVCRQALGSLTQYVGMDDAQRGHYLEVLDDAVGIALKSRCKSSLQPDAGNIVCTTK